MRVTVDYDTPSMFKVTYGFCVLRLLRGKKNVFIRRSASGHSFHLKAHGFKLSMELIIVLRLILGDDRMRIKLDLRRQKKPKQILWSRKDGAPAGHWAGNLREVMI